MTHILHYVLDYFSKQSIALLHFKLVITLCYLTFLKNIFYFSSIYGSFFGIFLINLCKYMRREDESRR